MLAECCNPQLTVGFKLYIITCLIFRGMLQRCNQVTTADPDDPLTQIGIRVRPRLINQGVCQALRLVAKPAVIQTIGVALKQQNAILFTCITRHESIEVGVVHERT